MDTNVFVPKRLADCNFTIFATCLYEKAIKIPRKTKTARSTNEYESVASVGDF